MFDPANHADPADQVLDGLAALAGEDRDAWSGAARSARVAVLAEIVERSQAELVRATGSWDAISAWAEDGAVSPIAWLAHFTRTASARATRLVRAARLARRHERTAKALAAGDLTSDHLDTLAKATRRREALYPDHEDALLDAAATMNTDDFRKIAATWRSHADDALANADAFAAVEHAHLDAGATFAGRVVMHAEFDPERGATVLAALDARCQPDPYVEGLPPRSLSQRRAAALVEIAAESLDRAATGGHPPTGVDLVADPATLSGTPPADLTAIRCEIDGVGPIAAETARRLCCDAMVGRVLMRGRSEVLDLGRRTRVVSPAQRRALVHRDGGCVFPGCHRHPWTDAHHLVHWARGGTTDLDNLCLLCRRHHTAVHEGGWKLECDGLTGEWIASRPP
jgi:hypothetical protein